MRHIKKMRHVITSILPISAAVFLTSAIIIIILGDDFFLADDVRKIAAEIGRIDVITRLIF